MTENRFPDDYKALKTAIGCIIATVDIYRNGVAEEYKRVMFMRTSYDTIPSANGLEKKYIQEGGHDFWKLKSW
jgi:hypothetical protein